MIVLGLPKPKGMPKYRSHSRTERFSADMETESVAVPLKSRNGALKIATPARTPIRNIQHIGNKDQTHCRNKGESKRTRNKAETKVKANGYETWQTPPTHTYEIILLPDSDPTQRKVILAVHSPATRERKRFRRVGKVSKENRDTRDDG